MTDELYKKYRPRKLKQMAGQYGTVRALTEMIKNNNVPHTILFTGSSGCGKTTLARILKDKLECSENDFSEINCANFRGIEMVRSIQRQVGQSPMGGKSRVWLIDECHKLSKDAQNAFLKLLEDTPSHIYFFLATTDPQKLLKTVVTRCTIFKMKELLIGEMEDLLSKICKKEGKTITKSVLQSIIKHSDGSPRQAIVLLNQIINMKKEKDQLECISSIEAEAEGIEICRALFRSGVSWNTMSNLLLKTSSDPETVRWSVLGYANVILLKNPKQSHIAYLIIEAFRDNFYDSKKAGLSSACYEVITGLK